MFCNINNHFLKSFVKAKYFVDWRIIFVPFCFVLFCSAQKWQIYARALLIKTTKNIIIKTHALTITWLKNMTCTLFQMLWPGLSLSFGMTHLNTACSRKRMAIPTTIPTQSITKLPAWCCSSSRESSDLILCL